MKNRWVTSCLTPKGDNIYTAALKLYGFHFIPVPDVGHKFDFHVELILHNGIVCYRFFGSLAGISILSIIPENVMP